MKDGKEKNKENIDLVVKFLEVVSKKNRFKILRLLKNKKMCVGKICRALKLPQNLVSHHLKILKNFGLISSEREGVRIFYRMNKKIIRDYLRLMDKKLNSKL